MKRFVWITTIVFGGGIAALMVASMILQRQVERQPGGVPSDLRTTMRGVQHALTHWQEKELVELASEDAIFYLWHALTDWRHTVPPQPDERFSGPIAYNKMFDAVGQADPHKVRKYKSLLSALETFPSITFPNMTPERIDIQYEVVDGDLHGWLAAQFTPGDSGCYLERFALETGLPGERAEGDLFSEGAGVPAFEETMERLLATLISGKTDELRSVMVFKPETSDDAVRKEIDRIRKQMPPEIERRIKKMLPVMGPLPRGTQWVAFRVAGIVPGETGDRKLALDMKVTLDVPIRIVDFQVGHLRERGGRRP